MLVVGPRRAGKTTLVQNVGGKDRTYINLDDQTLLEAAVADPAGFVRGLDTAEVQRAPELLLAIKKSIDEDYRAGRFLLTGSANVLTLPKVADSLAGRIGPRLRAMAHRGPIRDAVPEDAVSGLAAGHALSKRAAKIGPRELHLDQA